MRTFAVSFPHPPREVSPNFHRPVDAKAAMRANYVHIAAKQKVRDAAILRVRAALGGRRFVPHLYEVVWYYKGVRPDADNCLARCKALLDGAARAMHVDDQVLDCRGVRRVHTMERSVAGTVEVVFTGEWEGGGHG